LIMQYFSLPSLKPSSTMQWKELLLMPSHPIARKGLIIFTLIFLAHFSAYNYFTVFFKQTAGFLEGQISALLLFFGIASVVGNVLTGYVGKYNVRYSFAISALLLAMAFLALSIWDFNWTTSAIFVFLWGTAAGMVPATINMWMHIHTPELTEKGLALITFMFLILITIGSLVGGYVMDNFDGYVLMISMLIVALFAFFLIFTLARGLKNNERRAVK
ncbi:MFS transporter, partial [Xenorhabdus thuongxuanensis]